MTVSYTHLLTYADGKLFVQVGNGCIQAVDLKTLRCLWYTEKIGGQTLCPISYTNIEGTGYIYSGTWAVSYTHLVGLM